VIGLDRGYAKTPGGRLDPKVSDLGATPLINIAEPLRVYSLQVGHSLSTMTIVCTTLAV
jgi:hypothetical protein